MNKQDLIDKFLSRMLSKEDQEEFDQLYNENADFRSDVDFHKVLRKVVVADEKEFLKKRLQTLEKKEKSFLRFFIIVAVALLVLLLGYFLQIGLKQDSSDLKKLYASNFEAFPNNFYPVSRINEDSLALAFTTYENENYKLTIELFDNFISKGEHISQISFYKAISQMKIKDYESAIQSFDEVDDEIPIYGIEKYWYLGLISLKKGKLEDAKGLFEIYKLKINDERPLSKVQTLIDAL